VRKIFVITANSQGELMEFLEKENIRPIY